ncbi:MAG: hypothetical protein KAH18_03455 [Psychromonas sp.]|nr:hypothetical protein [Psychromonas sp.]
MKRNIGKRGYRAIKANNNAIKRRTRAASYPVITIETVEYIASKLKEKWIPDQITGRLKSGIEKIIKVSHETIYKFILKTKSKATISTNSCAEKLKNIIQDLRRSGLGVGIYSCNVKMLGQAQPRSSEQGTIFDLSTISYANHLSVELTRTC